MICDLVIEAVRHEKEACTVSPNVFTVRCLFPPSSHGVFYICMLGAGRPPALAAAATPEQMSHLVCVISVVAVTSWSLSNTLVSWLMAPADSERIYVCVSVSMQKKKMLHFL